MLPKDLDNKEYKRKLADRKTCMSLYNVQQSVREIDFSIPRFNIVVTFGKHSVSYLDHVLRSKLNTRINNQRP